MALTENDRFTFVLGPSKIEKILVTSDGTDDDTIETRLQNPRSVKISSANTDLSGTASGTSMTVSDKTLTIRNPAAQDYEIEVTGF